MKQFTTAGNWSIKAQRQLKRCHVPESRKSGFNAQLLFTRSPAMFTTRSKYWSVFSSHCDQKDRRNLLH